MGDQATDHSTIFACAQRVDAAHQQIQTLQSRLTYETDRPGDNSDFDRIYEDFDTQFEVVSSSLSDLHESLTAHLRTLGSACGLAPANASLQTTLEAPTPPEPGNMMDSTTQELTRTKLLDIGREDLFNLLLWLKEGLDTNTHGWDERSRKLYEEAQHIWEKATATQTAIFEKAQASSEFSV